MNERIKELISAEVDEYYEGAYADGCARDRLTRFAESIIEECAQVSQCYAGGTLPLSISFAIKRHFGIKG